MGVGDWNCTSGASLRRRVAASARRRRRLVVDEQPGARRGESSRRGGAAGGAAGGGAASPVVGAFRAAAFVVAFCLRFLFCINLSCSTLTACHSANSTWKFAWRTESSAAFCTRFGGRGLGGSSGLGEPFNFNLGERRGSMSPGFCSEPAWLLNSIFGRHSFSDCSWGSMLLLPYLGAC